MPETISMLIPSESPVSILRLSNTFVLLYSATMACGASERAILIPLPISLLFAAYAFELLYAKYARYQLVTVPLRLMLVAYFMYAIRNDVLQAQYHYEKAARYKDIERIAVENKITNAFNVYTTDHDVYFSGIKPYRPAFNGSWIRVGTYVDAWLFKEPRLDSLEAFLQDCNLHGYRLIYLIKGSGEAAPFLEGLRTGEIKSEKLKLIKDYGDARLYSVLG